MMSYCTLEDHVKPARNVLTTLAQHSLFVKLSKCEFHKDQLTFLGYQVSTEGFVMDPEKVVAVRDWEPPRTRK